MSKALYRKYRSKTLDELVGQKHITDILNRAVKTGRISHAYLLTGPRGVGKTSVARILAHQINEIEYSEDNTNLDIIEIDAASNNGVEDVRDLREKVQIAPVSLKKKIYIIDEVHMLSKAAFNALLKTLEEPPEHVVFILATTNLEKLPATIISRTQKFHFHSISRDDLVKHLGHIAKQEKIKIEDDALELIANRGDGSFRDSIGLLDQLSNIVDKDQIISAEIIETSLGLATNQTIKSLLGAAINQDIQAVITIIENAVSQGVDSAILAGQIAEYIIQNATEYKNILALVSDLVEVAKSHSPKMKMISIFIDLILSKQPKNIALSVATPTISKPIKELEKQAVQPKPKIQKIAPQSRPKKEVVESATKRTKKTPVPSAPFEWDNLLSYTKKNFIALHSVLARCGYELSDGILTIYTGNNFYKKKLDDAKYSQLLYESLEQIGSSDIEIITLPEKTPIKSSQAAMVADIMGGGEEVNVESVS